MPRRGCRTPEFKSTEKKGEKNFEKPNACSAIRVPKGKAIMPNKKPNLYFHSKQSDPF